MNNSAFGKTIENIRKRVDVRLLIDRKKAKTLAFKVNYIYIYIYIYIFIYIYIYIYMCVI